MARRGIGAAGGLLIVASVVLLLVPVTPRRLPGGTCSVPVIAVFRHGDARDILTESGGPTSAAHRRRYLHATGCRDAAASRPAAAALTALAGLVLLGATRFGSPVGS